MELSWMADYQCLNTLNPIQDFVLMVVVSMYMEVFCNSRLYTSKLQGT